VAIFVVRHQECESIRAWRRRLQVLLQCVSKLLNSSVDCVIGRVFKYPIQVSDVMSPQDTLGGLVVWPVLIRYPMVAVYNAIIKMECVVLAT
jgi:hypothetical protein